MRTRLARILLTTLLALGFAACASDGDDASTEGTSLGQTTATAGKITVTPTKTESRGTPEGVSAAIGERVEVDGYPDIIVEDFVRTTDPQVLGLGEVVGLEFFIMTIRVINDTDEPAGVDQLMDLTLLSRGEEIQGRVLLAGGWLGADELPPGGETTGQVAWNAAPGLDDLALQYSPISQANEETVEQGEVPKRIVNLAAS